MTEPSRNPQSGAGRGWTGPLRYDPPPAEVDALIEAAMRHPLGLEFLLNGHLGSVAIMFRTHAFTVVAARDRLTAS